MALQTSAAKWRQQPAHFSDGTSALLLLVRVTQQDPAVLSLWRKKYPDSVFPIVSSIGVHTSKAWESRGGGYANSVSKEGWKGFARELQLAEADCQLAVKKDPGCAILYREWITVAMGADYSAEDTHKLFERGVRADPTLIEMYGGYAPTILDRWGGTLAQRKTFLLESTRVLDPQFGKDAGYALACLDLAGYSDGGPVQAEEELGPLDKARLRRGMRNLAQHFPQSQLYPDWDIRFTLLHATAEEKAYSRKLLKTYGKRLDPAIVDYLK